MKIYDVTIVGAGVMGAAAACELAREGASVALIDQSSIPNPRAASIDHSKVFRFAYPERLYVKLAVDAFGRWRELESTTAAPLLTPTGALLICKRKPAFETECYDAMRSLGLEAELLDRSQIEDRFPQFDNNAFAYAVFDPGGGILHAEAVVGAMVDLARKRGVETVEGERVINIRNGSQSRVLIATESGTEIESGRAMISSGPWSRKLLPELDHKLITTRQELVYFQPDQAETKSFEANSFPIFLELESGFYGFPVHHAGAMKIANHHKGDLVDPDSIQEAVGEQFIKSCRAFFSSFIPGLANATVLETRVCFYNNTPDDDFIVDWHPQLENVLLVTGFSGHGFKFGPTIGRIAADLLLSGVTEFEIDRFRLTRFNNK